METYVRSAAKERLHKELLRRTISELEWDRDDALENVETMQKALIRSHTKRSNQITQI